MKNLMIVFLSVIFCFGCTAAQHQQNLHSTKEREFTVGLVQKEIRVGMSQTDVAEALGSPNIVTKDKMEKNLGFMTKSLQKLHIPKVASVEQVVLAV